jgi:hypothetical protein
MDRKKSGRMTDIPQLGPEVYVDDEDTLNKQRKSAASPLLSPTDITETRNSFITYGLDGAPLRQRRGTDVSINTAFPSISSAVSPTLSPHPSNSGYNFDTVEVSGISSGHSSRRNSAVSAENVLEVLDNSAWGESIRRSFTMKRPSKSKSGSKSGR